LSEYFLKIASGLQKECGERPHNLRIKDENFLQKHYQTENSVLLKNATEKMLEKFEVIGSNIVNLQRNK